MIILLDLNFTLVSNSDVKVKPFSRQVIEETYRLDLLDAIEKEKVILVTARPEKYRAVTLKSLQMKTGWQPFASHFNDLNLRPWLFKERVLVDRLLKIYSVNELFAIESNPRTRAMYDRYKVKAITADEFLKGKND